jgi:hypothetical protein
MMCHHDPLLATAAGCTRCRGSKRRGWRHENDDDALIVSIGRDDNAQWRNVTQAAGAGCFFERRSAMEKRNICTVVGVHVGSSSQAGRESPEVVYIWNQMLVLLM